MQTSVDDCDASTRPVQEDAWGKLSRLESGVKVHPLLDHMIDVAACFTALARCPGFRRALERLASRPLGDADLQRLAALVFLHDLGKANAGFQAQRLAADDPLRGYWPCKCGHGPEGWALIKGEVSDAQRLLSSLPLERMACWGDAAVYALLHASTSHHGRPVGETPRRDNIWRPVRTGDGRVLYDPAATLADIGKRLPALFPLAFGPCRVPLPEAPGFVHLFAGLVQLADWLGSDTRPGFFPYTEPGEDRAATAAGRAQRAVRTIGLDVAPWRDTLSGGLPDFAEVFQVREPRPMQTVVAEPTDGRVVVLEAETGSGKTEAALWRFARLFAAGAVDGLYFALPTRVAASQLYGRLREFVARVWPLSTPVVVRALPGYECADDQAPQRLPDFRVLWPDHPDDATAHRRWAAESPKRFLAATVAVGTIDQALLGALQVRHAHLRHALMSRSLLVVDEVHASDAYMTTLLEHLLRAHVHAGGHALLLSATLGAAARSRYLHLETPRLPVPVPPLQQACDTPYPALGVREGGQARVRRVEGNPRAKTVHWKTLDAIDDPARVAGIAADAAAQGARVLVVRNTVPAAVATLRALEALLRERGREDLLFRVGDTSVSTLHHSRFSRQDRPLLDAAVEAQLGKKRVDRCGRVVIGTQTLEQSLDLDADLLITDLCPMDVLLQRLGRLHRHARPDDERPTAFREPAARVLTPRNHDLAPMLKRARFGLGRFRDGGGVYPDLRIVEATRRLVDAQPTRCIPRDNRVLVEQATHPEALAALEKALGEDWAKLGRDIAADTCARKVVGNLHAFPFDKALDDVCFPDQEEKVTTRLGAADRLLEFDPAPIGPFGLAVQRLAVRPYLLPKGLAPDAQPADISPLAPGEGGFEFTLGDQRYRYGRFGLQKLDNDDEREDAA